MGKNTVFFAGILLLLTAEILSVYFIMPFPGSQRSETVDIAYLLHKNLIWIRITGLLLLVPALIRYLKNGRAFQKGIVLFLLALYGLVFYFVHFRLLADHMFYQPTHKIMVAAALNQVDTNKLVLACYEGGEAAAYPIEIIGYHHQVQDTVGGVPVMVSYCTVCRTGRIFNPVIDHKKESFRLVGMDHFNALFEDKSTRSWWRQATGEAIAGKRKGMKLAEIPSCQMRLGSWIRLHPDTRIMQPDSLYQKDYQDLQGYDSGTVKSKLEKRDSSSWNFKSWVIGISVNGNAKAYDWNELAEKKLINDQVSDIPIVLFLEPDGMSFHSYRRNLNGQTLRFVINPNGQPEDLPTHSSWNWTGVCTTGVLKGSQLYPIQSYQEFWHSWQSFHPNTSRYHP